MEVRCQLIIGHMLVPFLSLLSSPLAPCSTRLTCLLLKARQAGRVEQGGERRGDERQIGTSI